MIETRRVLAGLTSLRIGGPAERFAAPAKEGELYDVLRRAADRGEPVRALGGGKNLLIGDGGVRGTVVSFAGLKEVRFYGTVVVAGAGASLAGLAGRAAKLSLSGLECLVGVPGTVGGAVRMNAGGSHGSIGERVLWVRGYTKAGQPFRRSGPDCGFGYRHSALSDVFVVEVGLRLRPTSADVAARMKEIFLAKKAVQPLGAATAGCMFKNPSAGPSAGALLDRAGLKGEQRGGARYSSLHANFVENAGGASYADVCALVREGHRRVRESFGVDLSLEVKVWCEEEEAPLAN